MSAIQADYKTNKHIPSRKCYQLIMEVAEENFPEVCNILGYPKTGESTYVGIARLNPTIRESHIVEPVENVKTEGERLRTRAVMLCKDALFQDFVADQDVYIGYGATEQEAKNFILNRCNIKSRSELATNADAQQNFHDILDEFESWKLENAYKDNLERV